MALVFLSVTALHLPSSRPRPALVARASTPLALSGVITGAAARLAQYDKNKDGVLSPEELAGAYEDAANRVSATAASEPIIRQFEARATWLWV